MNSTLQGSLDRDESTSTVSSLRTPSLRLRNSLAYVGFALLVLGAKLVLIAHFGNITPYWDQWDSEGRFLYQRWLEGNLPWQTLFSPHNEHRIFVHRVLSLALFEANGLRWDPLLQMVVTAVLHAGALLMLVAFISRALPHGGRLIFLVFSALVWIIPFGWENTLAGFQSSFSFMLLFSFLFLWALVRWPTNSPRWWLGIACGVFACLSIASGALTIVAGAALLFFRQRVGVVRERATWLVFAGLLALAAVVVFLTPTVAGHATLHAQSVRDFVRASGAVLAWPVTGGPLRIFAVVMLNVPLALFVLGHLRRPPPAHDPQWFIFAMALWLFGQVVSIAYGRSNGVLVSRYLDVFAIGLLLNLASVILLLRPAPPRRGAGIALAAVWMTTVTLGFAGTMPDIASNVRTRASDGMVQERNVREYLATGDFALLRDAPFLAIPYPNAAALKSMLDSPAIRNLLPGEILPALKPRNIEVRGLVLDGPGTYPITPKPMSGTLFGTYGSIGNPGRGTIEITYDSPAAGFVTIPVAGYPLHEGMSITVQDSSGSRQKLAFDSEPRESWQPAVARVAKGPFKVTVEDQSSTHWVAVSLPQTHGTLFLLRTSILQWGPGMCAIGVTLFMLHVLLGFCRGDQVRDLASTPVPR